MSDPIPSTNEANYYPTSVESTDIVNESVIETTNASTTTSSGSPSTSTNQTTPIATVESNIATIAGGSLLKSGYFQSSNFVHGSSGWRIDSNGNVEFGDGYFRGDITGATGTFTGTVNINALNIPDSTTDNSFHVDSTGLAWWGANVANKANAPIKIHPDGLIEAKNAEISGIIRGGTFQYDVVSAVGGQLLVANADVLDTAMTALDASTLTTKGTTTFSDDDIILIRGVATTGIQEEYLQITDASSAPTYTVTRDLAHTFTTNNNPAWKAGTTIVKQGAVSSDQNTNSLKVIAGSSQTASIADASQTGLDLSGDFTLECWVKVDSTPATEAAIISKYGTAEANQSYQMLYRMIGGSPNLFVQWRKAAGGDYCEGIAYVDLGTTNWHHIAVTVDISVPTVIFYLDGVAVPTTTNYAANSINNTTTKFVIGGQSNDTNYFDGLIDDVRVWQDVRTPVEILANYNVQLTGSETDLVGYWKFNGSALDETANNNDLTLNGSPTYSVDTPPTTGNSYTGGWLRLIGEGNNSPYYSVMARSGSGYNTFEEACRFGNLNGHNDFAIDTYGISIGNKASGDFLTYDNVSGNLVINNSTLSNDAFFGDGADGDGIISSDTTLISDMFYDDNLTVNDSVTLNTGGYRIFVNGTLTNYGTISRNGGAGGNGSNGGNGSATISTATGGIVGTGGTVGAGCTGGSTPASIVNKNSGDGVAGRALTLAGSTNGGNGSAGTNSTIANKCIVSPAVIGSNAGKGGNANAATGGTKGSAGTLAGSGTPILNRLDCYQAAYLLFDQQGTSAQHNVSPTNSGSGGAGSGAVYVKSAGNNNLASGGGGGGGGAGGNAGVVSIFAKKIINSGTICANGGNGGKGGNGGLWALYDGGDSEYAIGGSGGGGGGVGGNGGAVILVYGTLENTRTIEANGGTGGTKGNKSVGKSLVVTATDGDDGVVGNNGTNGVIIYLPI